MNDKCDAKVYDRGGWHSWRCDRPVKAVRVDRDGKEHGVCGTHARARIVWHMGGSASKIERKS